MRQSLICMLKWKDNNKLVLLLEKQDNGLLVLVMLLLQKQHQKFENCTRHSVSHEAAFSLFLYSRFRSSI
jgi:hypothetical protein